MHKMDCSQRGKLLPPLPDEFVQREAKASVALDNDPECMTVSGSFGPAAEMASKAMAAELEQQDLPRQLARAEPSRENLYLDPLWTERLGKLAEKANLDPNAYLEQLIRRQWTASGGGRS